MKNSVRLDNMDISDIPLISKFIKDNELDLINFNSDFRNFQLHICTYTFTFSNSEDALIFKLAFK